MYVMMFHNEDVGCVNDHNLLSSKEFVMGALVTEEVAKGVAEVQVTVH